MNILCYLRCIGETPGTPSDFLGVPVAGGPGMLSATHPSDVREEEFKELKGQS